MIKKKLILSWDVRNIYNDYSANDHMFKDLFMQTHSFIIMVMSSIDKFHSFPSRFLLYIPIFIFLILLFIHNYLECICFVKSSLNKYHYLLLLWQSHVVFVKHGVCFLLHKRLSTVYVKFCLIIL